MLYPWLKTFLFKMDPENAHHFVMDIARLCPQIGKLSGIDPNERFFFKVGQANWSFPVGIAAGLDKNAEALNFFAQQGFGALECGTITLKPQNGNPRPRLFRYPLEESLRNAMGFPNQGLCEVLPRLKNYRELPPLGINLGKNKETDPDDSIGELTELLSAVVKQASYFVINVSSPNTPGLRALQETAYLTDLFTELNKVRNGKDLYLKIAPDLEPKKIRELVKLSQDMHLTGMIATNTTIMPERGAGGVSGRLLSDKARSVRQIILSEKSELELISVGGITRPADLFDLWKDGGKAAQVYTAYVYQGPNLLKAFNRELLRFVNEQQISLEKFFNLSFDERTKRLKEFRY